MSGESGGFTNAWRGLAGLPREIWVLFTASLVNRAGSMVLPFLAIYLTRARHLSPGTAGLVVALYGAGSFVAAPVSGWLCDRIGPIRIMRASLLLSGLVMLVFPLAESLPAIVAAVVALSVTSEAFRPANLALIGDLVAPERRKTAFSVNRLAINLGMSVGPALGGFLATVSFRGLFWVDGATSLAAGAILVFAAFPSVHESGAAEGAAAAGAPAGLRALRDARLVFFLLAGLLPVALVFFQHISTMPLFLVRDLAFSPAVFGMLFTVNTLLIVFLEVPLNAATSRWTARRTLVLGAALYAAGFGALAFVSSLPAIAATVVVWTFGEMFFFPGMAAYVSDIAPAARRGEYMGLTQMVMALAFMLGPWGGTALMQWCGGRTVWIVVLVLGAVSTALLLRLKEPQEGR